MEIEGLELKSETKTDNDKKQLDKTIDALSEAERIVGAQEAIENAARKREEDPLGGPVDVDGHVADDPVLRTANEATDLSEVAKNEVEEPTEEDKRAFLDAVSFGKRYERPFSMFGGAVTGVFRARTIGESEAIALYCRRFALTTSGVGVTEYGDLLRLCLIAVSVKSMGEVEYPEFKDLGNMRYVETEKGMDPPGWEKQLEVWRNKPEVFATSLIKEFNKFESKYRAMLTRSEDANFWKPGPSTGK